jgi:hypothetical protein
MVGNSLAPSHGRSDHLDVQQCRNHGDPFDDADVIRVGLFPDSAESGQGSLAGP